MAALWEDQGGINTYYTQDNHPEADLDSELERAEGAYGQKPEGHFRSMSMMIPGLRGLAIRDGDGGRREDSNRDRLTTTYWRAYETENYVVRPEILKRHAEQALSRAGVNAAGDPLGDVLDEILDALILERVFDGESEDFSTWKGLPRGAATLLWDARTRTVKLSDLAEEFFRRAGERFGLPILLRKGEFHRLVALWEPSEIPREVGEKLDLLLELVQTDKRGDA